jgi:sulfur carrier protein ThiS
MKIQVILYGTLRKRFADHDPIAGLHLELPEGSRVENLIEQLRIRQKNIGPVSVNGTLVKMDEMLSDLDSVRIYQPIFGG